MFLIYFNFFTQARIAQTVGRHQLGLQSILDLTSGTDMTLYIFLAIV